MRNSKNILKQSLIQVRNTLIQQDLEEELKSKRNNNNDEYIKHFTKKKTKEDIMLRNAYKNVITVITNIYNNIEDEKVNGKMNMLGTHRISDSKRPKNKRPIKKLISYDVPKIHYSLDIPKKTPIKTMESMKNQNTLNSNNYPFKLSLNWKAKKILNGDTNTEGSISELSSSSLNSGRNKQTRIIYKKHKLKENQFFKPKNALYSRWNSSKNVIIDSSKEKALKKSIINKNSIDNNLFNSSLSSCSLKNSFLLKSKRKSISILHRSSKCLLNISNYNSTIQPEEQQKETKRIEEPMSPFSNIHVKVQDIDTEDNASQHIFEENNSEITNETINNPITEKLVKEKRKQRIKKMISPVNYKKIISLKPLRGNLAKTFHKEKKFRFLLSKGNVYDSLDDEEESDEEDINTCYFEPNSNFLFVLDSFTLVSSLIILFYLPIYLSKKLFFCHSFMQLDTIIFYSIDFIYIFDLIINFYRSYYNFEENLIKNNYLIFLHYLKTWFLFDLISSIPIYTILNTYEGKCIIDNIFNDSKLINNGMHSYHYNINLNNMHYILLLLKVIKTLKIFKRNIALNKIRKYCNEINFFNNWGDVLLYVFFFVSFLNLAASIFIFLGRNIFESWIYLNDLKEKNFNDIYIGAIYYLVMTVTTVGYGDVLGNSITEIIFQIIMVIVGTCIYSWIISSVSNYVKKMNERNIKYEEKIQILEEIKLNSHINKNLYNKIIRLLNYRKYHEEENEKNIILESVPNALKNTLLIEMYKTYINEFTFFKGIENRDFIVQIISKLSPIIGTKGDILIQEGEYIEEIIFVKNGVLSLEVWIDMIFPEESIHNYLIENGFIDLKGGSFFKSSSKYSKNSTINPFSRSNLERNTTFNQYFERIDNKNEIALNGNKKKLKILDIRKNEHFGDVFMFLNKKSPLYVRVHSRVVDLLFLKKLDAISISDRYPDIWKNVIKKPLENSKIISSLTIKTLSTFCNLYGIKTKLFRKKNKKKFFPKYYLKPSINKKSFNSFKRSTYSHSKREKEIRKVESSKFTKKKGGYNLQQLLRDKIELINKNKPNLNENSAFTFYNNNSGKNNNQQSKNLESNSDNKSKIKSALQQGKNDYKIFVSKYEDNDKEISQIMNVTQNDSVSVSKSFNISKNNTINTAYNNRDKNIEQQKQKESIDMSVNDEILPEEIFNLQIYEDEKPNGKINNLQKILPDNIYINNLNINYMGVPLKQNTHETEKKEKKTFDKLSISSSISTLTINSSYENINEITAHRYINNIELRMETRHFLLEKCNINKNAKSSQIYKNKNFYGKFLNVRNYSKNASNNLSLYSSSIHHNNINRINSRNNYASEIIRKTVTNEFNNKLSYETLNDFRKLLSKSEKSIANLPPGSKKFEKALSSNSVASLGLMKSKVDNTFDSLNDIDINATRKKTKINNSKLRKKQQLKELDIISSNIQKSSQNLHHPDLFYAGLFNDLMFKDYPQLKENNYYIEQNDEIKEVAKESDVQDN